MYSPMYMYTPIMQCMVVDLTEHRPCADATVVDKLGQFCDYFKRIFWAQYLVESTAKSYHSLLPPPPLLYPL